MAAPKEIEDLVARFEQNIESYKSGHYNETQLRREFVDPFFEALGWDVNNKQGFAEAYKDVIHEEAIRVGATTKAPDYSFRIGGQRKFFLETKKPSVDIKEDIHPAFQLRRYAWTAKLPLSILTDFEEFAVYDCRIKPDKADKSSQARVMYIPFREYQARWDEIAGIFSKEAILKGSFDKFAEDKKSKRGTAEVDAAFLEEIAGWREVLARNIALRNPDLSTKDLNYAVQTIVNRIVFLRICEDRGIERHMRLQDLLNGERIYPRLCELFHRADERYNSGLFHFEKEPGREDPDTLTLSLSLDDKPLKDIIRRLYYPDCPYEFSVFPAEILGQVYEQFLGKVIRLTEGHRAVVEDKPEVKKAGGVKYTPVYIVDYIVKTTMGPMLEGKTPQQAVSINVLDPACGSGSFLIVAYQYLLDWHREWYVQKLVPLLQNGQKTTSAEIRRLLPGAQNEKGKKGRKREPELPIYQGRGGEWRLTTAERKRILLNNIYGVDIDSQAVEVTKLSLLLKVLEGENEETIEKQLKLFQERALPDLGNNIKCGNSLIGWDILEDESGLTQNEIDRINPFDWEKEFPKIMQEGGFDAVIGNPPYIRIHNLVDFYPQEVRYIRKNFVTAGFGKVDIYVPFIERAHTLLRSTGILGFIVPNKFMRADYGVELRKFIAEKAALDRVIDFGHAQVFDGVTTYTCLLFLSGNDTREFYAGVNVDGQDPEMFLREIELDSQPTANLTEATWSLSNSSESALINKIENIGTTLPYLTELLVTGIKTGANHIFIFELIERRCSTCLLKQEDGDEIVELESSLLMPYWKAESMKRYYQIPAHRLLLYPYKLTNGKTELIPQLEMKKAYPLTWSYLNNHKNALESRQKGKLKEDNWYGLSFASDLRMFSGIKIVTPTLAMLNSFTIDSGHHFFPQGAGGGCGIIPTSGQSGKYMIGILNSRLLTFYFQRISSRFQGGFFAYEPRYLRRIPIRVTSKDDPIDIARHDRMVSLVNQMLSLHKQLQEAQTPHEKTALQRQIEANDRQIDALVYELYGLTEEEIEIVEKATK